MDLDIDQRQLEDSWLVRALGIVHGGRSDVHGDIGNNWRRLALMAQAIFDLPAPATYTQIAYFLEALKMVRELDFPDMDTRDYDENNLDICGYQACLQAVKDGLRVP